MGLRIMAMNNSILMRKLTLYKIWYDNYFKGNLHYLPNEHKKILFYINEVYVYIKIKYDLNIKKEYIQLQHKKYQELEIVHKLKK